MNISPIVSAELHSVPIPIDLQNKTTSELIFKTKKAMPFYGYSSLRKVSDFEDVCISL